MANANRMASFLATMKWEGRDKLSMDPKDPGNWTGGKVGIGSLRGSKFGVSAMTCARMFPGKTPETLTEDNALEVFVTGYWAPIGADIMATGVDHCVSDDAYNAGPGSAMGRWRRGGFTKASDPVATIHAYSALRLSFLEALRTWKIYGRGWAARVAGVEAESIVMAHAKGAALPIVGQGLSDHLAGKSGEADAKVSTARATATAGVAIGALAPSVSPGMPAWGILAAGALVGLHQLWTAHVEAARREALGDAADKVDA